MLRLLLALSTLFFNLFACSGGLESCRQKVIDSQSIINKTVQLPIQKNQRLVFSTTKPHATIIKHDPFLSLYLIEDKKGFQFPFKINMKYDMGAMAVDDKQAIKGKIVQKQVGLEQFALFSKDIASPSLILNDCCALEGIVTPKGVIQKEYIERFLKAKIVSYSDFGIRVNDVGSVVSVSSSNPFMKENSFKKNDAILELDGKKVKDSASLMRNILFSQVGSMHTLKVKRDGQILTLKVKSQPRVGGGFLSDTFLEFLGLSFDESLKITKIQKIAERYGLKIGDKLLQIDTKSVQSGSDISQIIDGSNKSPNLLFQRDGFQFFVKLN